MLLKLNNRVLFPDFEGKTDSKIRVLEVVEELKAQRADKQVWFQSHSIIDLCGIILQSQSVVTLCYAVLGYDVSDYLFFKLINFGAMEW